MQPEPRALVDLLIKSDSVTTSPRVKMVHSLKLDSWATEHLNLTASVFSLAFASNY